MLPVPIVADAFYLTGPTASGKTALGILLAERLNAEIISLDSMALYRGMDIGTAKPTAAERVRIPHHLIDVLQPSEISSVADYVKGATSIATDIAARGKRVLFVGGTPLYLKCCLRGIFSGPTANWELRNELEAELVQHGATALHARLAAVDPQTAQRLVPEDSRRVIRALEVYAATGQSIGVLQKEFDRARPAAECKVFCLNWPRDVLRERINARVDAMFSQGLVAEAQQLLAAPALSFSRTAAQAVGYKEVIDHLRGERSLAEAIELVKLRTRQFAKRQMTWFRSLSECRMVAMTETSDLSELANTLAHS